MQVTTTVEETRKLVKNWKKERKNRKVLYRPWDSYMKGMQA